MSNLSTEAPCLFLLSLLLHRNPRLSTTHKRLWISILCLHNPWDLIHQAHHSRLLMISLTLSLKQILLLPWTFLPLFQRKTGVPNLPLSLLLFRLWSRKKKPNLISREKRLHPMTFLQNSPWSDNGWVDAFWIHAFRTRRRPNVLVQRSLIVSRNWNSKSHTWRHKRRISHCNWPSWTRKRNCGNLEKTNSNRGLNDWRIVWCREWHSLGMQALPRRRVDYFCSLNLLFKSDNLASLFSMFFWITSKSSVWTDQYQIYWIVYVIRVLVLVRALRSRVFACILLCDAPWFPCKGSHLLILERSQIDYPHDHHWSRLNIYPFSVWALITGWSRLILFPLRGRLIVSSGFCNTLSWGRIKRPSIVGENFRRKSNMRARCYISDRHWLEFQAWTWITHKLWHFEFL